MNMNAEDVRKGSKYYKRSMKIPGISGVPNVKLICLTGCYLFSALALLSQMGVVQPGLPEQSVRGVEHPFIRFSIGKIKFRPGLGKPFRLQLRADEMEASYENNL
jgi:hypothetical protein